MPQRTQRGILAHISIFWKTTLGYIIKYSHEVSTGFYKFLGESTVQNLSSALLETE